jgi:hypothetical protein
MPSNLVPKLWKSLSRSNQVSDSIQSIPIPGSSSSFYPYALRGQYLMLGKYQISRKRCLCTNVYLRRAQSHCLWSFGAARRVENHRQSFPDLGLDDRYLNIQYSTFSSQHTLLYLLTFFLRKSCYEPHRSTPRCIMQSRVQLPFFNGCFTRIEYYFLHVDQVVDYRFSF